MIVKAIVRRVPLRVSRFLGRQLGRLAWYAAPRERRKALRNIAIAFPDWSADQHRRAIRAMFRHLGMSVAELMWIAPFTPERRDRTTVVEGIEPVLDYIAQGRGIVTFTGHCGNWEWLAATVGSYGRPVTVLQRERDEADMNQLITDIRAQSGIRTVDRGSSVAAREMIHRIRNGGFLAFLIDQNIRAESAKVPFFGRPALTPIGASKLAVRTEAVVVSAFIERRRDGSHYVRFNPPFEVKRTDDPIEITARITRDIEEQIRRVPEQWVWMHDRWRERPQWDVATQESEAK